MSEGFGTYDIKSLREALSKADINALEESGLLSERTIKKLISYKRSYEPNTGKHWQTGEPAYYADNTQYWHRTVEQEGSITLAKAVANGDAEQIAFALGWGNEEDKVKLDFVDYYRLKEVLETPALMLNMFGAPRTGKTFTTARLVELWLMFHPTGLVICNIQSWAEKHPKGHYETHLPSMIRATQEHDGPVLLFLDELSSELVHSDLQKSGIEPGLRQFLRKMGKEPYKCSYIGIGHRVTEIAPLLRSGEVAYFGFKEGRTKEAAQRHLVIYDNEERSDKGENNKEADLNGVGLPDTAPDTNDKGELDLGRPEDYVELGLMRPTEVPGNDDENGEAPTRCMGENKDGERCGTLIYDPETAYCPVHEDQADD